MTGPQVVLNDPYVKVWVIKSAPYDQVLLGQDALYALLLVGRGKRLPKKGLSGAGGGDLVDRILGMGAPKRHQGQCGMESDNSVLLGTDNGASPRLVLVEERRRALLPRAQLHRGAAAAMAASTGATLPRNEPDTAPALADITLPVLHHVLQERLGTPRSERVLGRHIALRQLPLGTDVLQECAKRVLRNQVLVDGEDGVPVPVLLRKQALV